MTDLGSGSHVGQPTSLESTDLENPARLGRLRGHRRRSSDTALGGQRLYLTVAGFAVVVAVAVPQFVASSSGRFTANLWLAYAIACIGFYWMIGLAGRPGFCQTFMMALGGYTSAWVTRTFGDGSFLLGLVGAMVVTGVLAAGVGIVVRKAQFFYFAIATIAVSQVGIEVFSNVDWFTGPNGTRTGISAPEVLGHRFIKDGEVFWLFLVVLIVVLVVAAWLERSPMRRDAVATRDNLIAAQVTGVATTKVQVLFFAFGSALGGLSGALIGHWNGVIGIDSFGFDLAIGLFLMLYLGGVGSMWGPVIGAAVIVTLPRLLSQIETYSTVVYGLMLLVVVLTLPEGIVGSYRAIVDRLDRLIRARRSATPGTPDA